MKRVTLLLVHENLPLGTYMCNLEHFSHFNEIVGSRFMKFV